MTLRLLAMAAATAFVATEPPFTSIQTAQFAVPNSYSNAWGDYDNDGDLDLAVSLGTGEVRLYRNDSGGFTSVGAAAGLPQAGYELRGLSWGDYDGDGDIDLLGGATANDKLTKVFRNDGAKFTDVAAEIGLTVPGRSARQTNFVDYDNDGDLDVYAADRTGENTLFRNDSGRFTRVFAGVGPTDKRPTVGACWLDYDHDGDLDLFLANQSGATDALWRNDGTAFVDVAPAAGVTGPRRTTDEGGGVAPARAASLAAGDARWPTTTTTAISTSSCPTTGTTSSIETTATPPSPTSRPRPASASRTMR